MRTNTDKHPRRGGLVVTAVVAAAVTLAAATPAQAGRLDYIYAPSLNLWATAIVGGTGGDVTYCNASACWGTNTRLEVRGGPEWLIVDALAGSGPVATACTPNLYATWRTWWEEYRSYAPFGITNKQQAWASSTIRCPFPRPIIIPA